MTRASARLLKRQLAGVHRSFLGSPSPRLRREKRLGEHEVVHDNVIR